MSLDLIDTHCHLHLEPLVGALGHVLARARAAGVGGCVTIATDVASSRVSLELARRHPGLRVAVGVHPEEAPNFQDAMFDEIEALSGDSAVGAIGEIGLDDYWRKDLLGRQAEMLRGFLAIARRRGLPVGIHCRGTRAYDMLIGVLREQGGPVSGVIHCASGSTDFIREALALGLHVSFAGNVTFPNAKALRELIPLVPDERVLLETDAPFLAPQPVRGQRNEPAYVAHTAAAVAQVRGTTPDALGEVTTRNARRLFGLSEAFH